MTPEPTDKELGSVALHGKRDFLKALAAARLARRHDAVDELLEKEEPEAKA